MSRRRWAGLCVAVIVGGCSDGPLGPEALPAPPPSVRSFVVGDALANLDARGHFRLPAPSVAGPHPLIGEEQATEIAMGVIRTWYANPDVITLSGAESLVTTAERGHEGPIDWAEVRPGPRRPYFAESHLEPLSEELGLPAVRHFGPRFLVPLYVGSVPVVVVSVSGYATNTTLDDHGFVRRSGNPTGGEFRVSGIPRSLGGITLPPAPEVAVRFAVNETGSRVSAVPVLGTPGNYVSSTGSRWRLLLEHEVDFVRLADGQPVVSREIFVGVWPSIADARLGYESTAAALRLFVAAPDQPQAQDLGWAEVPLRPGYAVDLHEVRPVG